MEYPNPIMRKTQFVKIMGADESEIMYLYRMRPDLKIAWKGAYRNSPIYVDTEKYEKYRKAACTGR